MIPARRACVLPGHGDFLGQAADRSVKRRLPGDECVTLVKEIEREPPGMFPAEASARANANLALIKYWGKRDPALNLPATGSISLTLDGLGTEAAVGFGGGEADRLVIDGVDAA